MQAAMSPLDPAEGDRFMFKRGEIRIDRVHNGWVYFVQWRAADGECVELGEPTRMMLDVWREAVAKEQLTRGEGEG